MLDTHGRFQEGLSSNFFAVMAGTLWTAEQDVLAGITRSLVIEAVHKAGLPLQPGAAAPGRPSRFDEVFITSSSRGVLPVRQIGEMRSARLALGRLLPT